MIELVVSAADGMARDVVKHLKDIEDEILQSLAWKDGSPLWDAIADGIPSYEAVTLSPGQSHHTHSILDSPMRPIAKHFSLMKCTEVPYLI